MFGYCFSDESEMTLMMNGTGEGIGKWCQFVYLIWLASKLTVFFSLSLCPLWSVFFYQIYVCIVNNCPFSLTLKIKLTVAVHNLHMMFLRYLSDGENPMFQ